MANANEILKLFNVPMSMAAARKAEEERQRAILEGGGREAEIERARQDMQSLAGLFGYTPKESPEMQRARAMEEAMKNIQYNDPASIDAARKAISAISPESGMAFDSYIMQRMEQQRNIQAKDLEMALKAQEAINAAGALPENAMTDTMANQVASDLANRGIISEDQAPMIAAQIQYEGKSKGGSITDILTRMGFGQQPQDPYGGVSSTGVSAPAQPQQGSSQKGGVAPRMR
jgi:hypothetical protein